MNESGVLTFEQKIQQAESRPAPRLNPAQRVLQEVSHEALFNVMGGISNPVTSPEEHRRDRLRITDNLPPTERDRFQEMFAQIDATREMIKTVFGGDLQGAIDAQTKLMASGLNDEQMQSAQTTLTYLNRLQGEIGQRLANFLELARQNNVGYATELANSKKDPYTGLFVRKALMEEFNRRIYAEYMKNPDGVRLEDHVIYALDMNNFKVGNTILTHEGFDTFIADMSNVFITASQYLTQDRPGEHPYGRFNPEDPRTQKAMKEVLKEGTDAMNLLEQARQEGITFELYRDKSGADEALFFVHYENGKTEAREHLAEQLTESIFHSHALPKHGLAKKEDFDPAKVPTKLVAMRHTAEDFPQHLKLSKDEMKELGRELRLDNDQIFSYLNWVAESAHRRLMGSQAARPITDDPDCLIRMGASATKIDMKTVWERFMYGTEPNGSAGPPEPGLIDRVTGKTNFGVLTRYHEQVYNHVHLVMSALGLQYRDLGPHMEHLQRSVELEASNPIIGGALERIFHHLEENVKPNDKMQLVLDAMRGTDAEKLYQLAALVGDGRVVDTLDKDPKMKFTILVAIEAAQHGTVKAEKRATGHLDEAILQGSGALYDAFLSEKGISRDKLTDFEAVHKAVSGLTARSPEEQRILDRLQAYAYR